MVTDTYHHGDLPTALRAATAELITERGPSGFSLREVARRAGVSHAAPAHHFGDARGLLTSVAAEGFGRLADALEEASEGVDDAAERLRRCGNAYVKTALAYPGHFAVIFQEDLIDHDDEPCLAESVRAYASLQRTVTMIRDQINPGLDVEAAATFTWATVQGLVVLAPKLADVAASTNTRHEQLDQVIDRFTDFILHGLAGMQP
jgi:AcrR family transcriptional regulator